MQAICRVLSNIYISFWRNRLYNDEGNRNGNKLRTYRNLKSDFELEKYLLTDVDRKAISTFVIIRISNSNLFIEKGRFNKIPLENKLCPLRNAGIEDEMHFILKCVKLDEERKFMFTEIEDCLPSFGTLGTTEKFKFILGRLSTDCDLSRICIQGIHRMYLLRQSLYKNNGAV